MSAKSPLGSIVIAAHDEEAVIARALGHLSDAVGRGEIDVIVVCNGCRDRTADVARGFPGVRVCELEKPSKTAALREGDRMAVPGPRLYLDADVELTSRAAVETLRALTEGAIAARPPHRFETTGAHPIVRRWYSVRERLPSISGALWGAGCYAVSEEGRSRFGEFPEVLGDDLFIDSLFAPEEVTIVATDPVVVRTPRSFSDLFRTKRRSYRTTQRSDEEGSGGVTLSPSQRVQARELGELVRREPKHAVDVGIYVVFAVLARLSARFGPAPRWERDASSRSSE